MIRSTRISRTLICLVLIFFSHCQKEQVPVLTGNDYVEKVRLEKTGEKVFALDSVAGYYNSFVQFIDRLDEQLLAVFNEATGRLHLYDYQSTDLITAIEYDKSGENGVGSFNRMGYYFHDYDSIFLYNYRTQLLFLTDSNGTVKNEYSTLPEGLSPGAAFPDVSTITPIFFLDDKIYFMASSILLQEDHTRLKVVFELDLNTGNISTRLPRPALYNTADYGIATKYRLFGCSVPKQRQFVYGFAADPNVYVLNSKGQQSAYLAASDYFMEVPPYSQERRTELYEDAAMKKHGMTTPEYSAVFYDSYQGVYFRYAVLPLSEEKYEMPGYSKLRPFSVIILDESFQKIGETKLSNKNYLPRSIITSDGLLIENMEAYKKDEKKLHFNVYEVKPNDKSS